MRRSSQKVPYLFHTSLKGMEAGKACGRRAFHTFHTFHTCFPRTRTYVCTPAHTRVHLHLRTPELFGMEGMEGMEEGHSTRVFSFHTSAIPRQGMEPLKEKPWN